MKLRRIISTLLLSIYLISTGGYAVDVFTCECHHEHQSHHTCCEGAVALSCGCHSSQADVSNDCCCHHELQDEAEFYNTSLRDALRLIACCITLSNDEKPLPLSFTGVALHAQRTTPLHSHECHSACGLRAPPVFV